MNSDYVVSIIMATYNRSHFIIETLEAIKKQTFGNWECIIIDDGSTDSTQEILQPYLISEPRIKYFLRSEKYKKGLPGCRNQGLDLARGDYIVFFDDDDIMHPWVLELCLKEIQPREALYCRYLRTIFTGDFHYDFNFDLNYRINHLDKEQLDPIIMNEIPFNSCQVLWDISVFSNIRFNEELMYAEEWECYSRILSNGISGISIEKVLFYGRKHSKSNTGEFRNNDPIRIASKIKAILLVIDNLSKKGLLSLNLVQYFIRTGFLLKEISLIEVALKYSNGGKLKRLKYLWGFRIYPILKPFFIFKDKLKKF